MSTLDTHTQFEVTPGRPEQFFELVEMIGSGTYGAVYRAMRRDTGEVVAVKQISLAGDDELRMIATETRIMTESKHPNIVTYYGTYKSLSAVWMVMEFCEGGSVDLVYKVLKRPMSERLIAYVCRNVLLGLQYLHSRGCIHRDIKGGNILITREGNVKLADFGVSVQLMHTMSRRNSFIGTVNWMAPEVMFEKDYDARADMWSLGITLIEMAESAPPHTGKHPLRILQTIGRDPPPTLRDADSWSVEMNQFLKLLLMKDYTLRPSAEDMLKHPFVRVENVGTREEMRELMMDEVIERLNKRRSGWARDEIESSSSNATFRRIQTNAHRQGSESGSDGNDNRDGGGDSVRVRRGKAHDIGGGVGAGGGGGAEHHHGTQKPNGAAGDGSSDEAFFYDGSLLPLPVFSVHDLRLDALCRDVVQTTYADLDLARETHPKTALLTRLTDAAKVEEQDDISQLAGLRGGRTEKTTFGQDKTSDRIRSPPPLQGEGTTSSQSRRGGAGGSVRETSSQNTALSGGVGGGGANRKGKETTLAREGNPGDGSDANMNDSVLSSVFATLLAYHLEGSNDESKERQRHSQQKQHQQPQSHRSRYSYKTPGGGTGGNMNNNNNNNTISSGGGFSPIRHVPLMHFSEANGCNSLSTQNSSEAELAQALLSSCDVRSVAYAPQSLMQVTSSLMDQYVYHKELPMYRTLEDEEAVRVAELTNMYGSTLKTMFRQ